MNLSIQGAHLVEITPHKDDRGAFSRLFCSAHFQNMGIPHKEFVQVNLSENPHIHTLRGMHYQLEPHCEAKVVYCLRGEIFDVIIDLRPSSPTYMEHTSVHLSEESPQALVIPPGCAHGFLTLKPSTHLLYLMSEFYYPESAAGVHYLDPAFNIQWPFSPKVISEKDRSYPMYRRKDDPK